MRVREYADCDTQENRQEGSTWRTPSRNISLGLTGIIHIHEGGAEVLAVMLGPFLWLREIGLSPRF